MPGVEPSPKKPTAQGCAHTHSLLGVVRVWPWATLLLTSIAHTWLEVGPFLPYMDSLSQSQSLLHNENSIDAIITVMLTVCACPLLPQYCINIGAVFAMVDHHS